MMTQRAVEERAAELGVVIRIARADNWPDSKQYAQRWRTAYPHDADASKMWAYSRWDKGRRAWIAPKVAFPSLEALAEDIEALADEDTLLAKDLEEYRADMLRLLDKLEGLGGKK